MKFISVTSKKDKMQVLINVETIGHIYETSENNYGQTENYTVIGTTTHNNGGFRVINSKDAIISAIMELCKTNFGAVKVL